MSTLQNFRPMTRAKMAQLSLPDIRAYAKAYKVPGEVIEHGTADELLDLIFRFRPRHPEEYPVNTPHLFTHKIARTQVERDEEFLNHKPYTGFAYRKNLASFRRAKSWIGRPSRPEGSAGRVGEAAEEEHRSDSARDEELEYLPAHPDDLLAVHQPVASSSATPTYEQPNPHAEDPQRKHSSPSSPPTPPDFHKQDPPPALVAPLPSTGDLPPSQPTDKAGSGASIPKEQGAHDGGDRPHKITLEDWLAFVENQNRLHRPPPKPPALGFEVADDLSNLKSALEEHQEATAARPEPSRIIVDDELFDLEFTPDMSQAGKEAIIHERYAVAMSNHNMIEQMLAEAEAEAKQALWQLTAIQPEIYAAHESMQKFIDEFHALTGRRNLIREAIVDGEKMAKDAWEADWNEEWICTEDDEKEDEKMKEIAQARAAGVQLPPSPSSPSLHSPSRKRTHDEDEDALEYADEEGPRAGTLGRGTKRPRVESRGTSVAPSSPSPRGKDKGKGRAFAVEDGYTLPVPSSSFCIPPLPMPRFGPKDRCNVYPVYKPAVPGYEPPRSPETEDGKQSGQHDGGNHPPSDEGDDSNGRPEPGQGHEDGNDGDEEQIGENEGEGEDRNDRDHNGDTTQMPRGAPPTATVQPEGPRRGNPWQVLRYDRAIWEGYATVTDHSRLPSDLKRQVDWSILGSRHPKGMSYREWDDELEQQNPWHQGGRPTLKQ